MPDEQIIICCFLCIIEQSNSVQFHKMRIFCYFKNELFCFYKDMITIKYIVIFVLS
jgi:hypothetical protein